MEAFESLDGRFPAKHIEDEINLLKLAGLLDGEISISGNVNRSVISEVEV
jgi:hypothetical protein